MGGRVPRTTRPEAVHECRGRRAIGPGTSRIAIRGLHEREEAELLPPIQLKACLSSSAACPKRPRQSADRSSRSCWPGRNSRSPASRRHERNPLFAALLASAADRDAPHTTVRAQISTSEEFPSSITRTGRVWTSRGMDSPDRGLLFARRFERTIETTVIGFRWIKQPAGECNPASGPKKHRVADVADCVRSRSPAAFDSGMSSAILTTYADRDS